MLRIMETHGMSNGPEYQAWCDMRARCYRKTHRAYRHYGGRGISVCVSWQKSFKRFFKDMGKRPDRFQLDRINNNKGYCKSNCRWTSPIVNRQNTRLRKLSEKAVRYIKKSNIKTSSLARLFCVCNSTISYIKRGKRWANIT